MPPKNAARPSANAPAVNRCRQATQRPESPRNVTKSRLNWPDQVMAAMSEKKIGSRFQPWRMPTISV